MKRSRGGLTLVEVLVALTLVAIQVPAVVATVATASTLVRRAHQVLAAIDPATAPLRCEAP